MQTLMGTSLVVNKSVVTHSSSKVDLSVLDWACGFWRSTINKPVDIDESNTGSTPKGSLKKVVCAEVILGWLSEIWVLEHFLKAAKGNRISRVILHDLSLLEKGYRPDIMNMGNLVDIEMPPDDGIRLKEFAIVWWAK
jgi:hypothetical protein